MPKPTPDERPAKVTLSTQRYRVVLGDPADLDLEDAWAEHEARPRNADSVTAEALFRRYKLGALADNPVTFVNAQIYGALTRTRAIDPHTSWEAFRRQLVDFELIDEADEVPTEPGPEPG